MSSESLVASSRARVPTQVGGRFTTGVGLGLAFMLIAGCADIQRGPRPQAPDAAAAASDGGLVEAGSGVPFSSVFSLLAGGCGGCHSPGQSAGNTAFLLSGSPSEDYAGVVDFVSPGAPAESRLLSKAAGQGHGGGAIYRPGTAEYDALAAWIAAGAMP